MGKADNRRSSKMLQRKAWRRKKLRLRKKIEEGKANKSGVARAKKPSAPASSSARRPAAE